MAVQEQWRKLQEELSLSRMQNEMCKLVDKFWHGAMSVGPLDGQDWAPLVDVVEQTDCFALKAELPGMDASQIDIRVEGRSVTISGEKLSDRPEVSPGQYLRGERVFGRFSRKMDMPADVDPQSVTATFAKGVLTIRLAKTQEDHSRNIPVESQD